MFKFIEIILKKIRNHFRRESSKTTKKRMDKLYPKIHYTYPKYNKKHTHNKRFTPMAKGMKHFLRNPEPYEERKK